MKFRKKKKLLFLMKFSFTIYYYSFRKWRSKRCMKRLKQDLKWHESTWNDEWNSFAHTSCRTHYLFRYQLIFCHVFKSQTVIRTVGNMNLRDWEMLGKKFTCERSMALISSHFKLSISLFCILVLLYPLVFNSLNPIYLFWFEIFD